MTYLPEPAGHLPVPVDRTREVQAAGRTADGDLWAVNTRETTSYTDPGAAMPRDRSGSSAVVSFVAGAMAAQVVSSVVVYFLYGVTAFVVLSAVFVALGGAVTVAAKR